MVYVNSLSSLNIASINSSKLTLSRDTAKKLDELGISISSVSSEAEAKKIIEEKTQAKEDTKNAPQTDSRLEKIYERLKTISLQMNVTFSSEEKIENVLSKIDSKISMFEDNNNPNINFLRSEYQAIQHAYEIITKSNAKLFTGLDILGKTNRVIMGISDIKK